MKTLTFTVALLASVTSAEQDFDLEKAVMKNLKWIRPPSWEQMPEDMDAWFNKDPEDKEPATKEDVEEPYYEPHDQRTHRYRSQREAQLRDYHTKHDPRGELDDHHYDEARRHYDDFNSLGEEKIGSKDTGVTYYPELHDRKARHYQSRRYEAPRARSNYDYDSMDENDELYRGQEPKRSQYSSLYQAASPYLPQVPYSTYSPYHPYYPPVDTHYQGRDPHSKVAYPYERAPYDRRAPRPLYRETAEEREAREHFEFGARYGKIDPALYAPAPQSHRRDPYDMHYQGAYDLYHRPEARPHWTDDDEKYSVDFTHMPRDPYMPGRPREQMPTTYQGTYGGDQQQKRQWQQWTTKKSTKEPEYQPQPQKKSTPQVTRTTGDRYQTEQRSQPQKKGDDRQYQPAQQKSQRQRGGDDRQYKQTDQRSQRQDRDTRTTRDDRKYERKMDRKSDRRDRKDDRKDERRDDRQDKRERQDQRKDERRSDRQDKREWKDERKDERRDDRQDKRERQDERKDERREDKQERKEERQVDRKPSSGQQVPVQDKRQKSPGKKSGSPKKGRSASPKKQQRPGSPKKSKSPKKSGSPQKSRPGSPKKSKSPKKSGSPQKSKSPQKQRPSSPKKSKSPNKEKNDEAYYSDEDGYHYGGDSDHADFYRDEQSDEDDRYSSPYHHGRGHDSYHELDHDKAYYGTEDKHMRPAHEEPYDDYRHDDHRGYGHYTNPYFHEDRYDDRRAYDWPSYDHSGHDEYARHRDGDHSRYAHSYHDGDHGYSSSDDDDEYFFDRKYHHNPSPNRYWQLLETTQHQDHRQSDERQKHHDSKRSERRDGKKGKEHEHYLHGSEDIAHHKAYFAYEDTSPHDEEDFGRYLHGSEDVQHHHRWYLMLQALEQEETRRQNRALPKEGTKEEQAQDKRQEQAQERETSFWQDRLAEERRLADATHFYQ